MYVRKFEADTLEEAMKSIKRELGPDAIILKTITNKWPRAAFKKKKIEITAAISEKNYVRKTRVDKVLTQDQKQGFYQGKASRVSEAIDQYSGNSPNNKSEKEEEGYGTLGLNRAVKTVKGHETKSKLDDFLKGDETAAVSASSASSASPDNIPEQKNKIYQLEAKLFELTKSVDQLEKKEPEGLYHLRRMLRSFDISEKYVRKLIQKALFEISENDLGNVDGVLEFAMREMMNSIQVEMPLFSSTTNNSPVITVLLSETSVGQTTMMLKLGALKSDAFLIQNVSNGNLAYQFSEQVLGIKVCRANGISDIIAESRKAIEQKKSVIIDYKKFIKEVDDTKGFINGLKRSFDHVEVLICLSGIHSELYNRKMVTYYGKFTDGIIMTNLDLCLNFGSLFNIVEEFQNLPLKFFGTGRVVPDDIEAATSERILANIFQLI